MGDVLLAIRWLRRNPLLTLAITGILGLGIAASTAVFSVVDPVLLRPLPYQAADRLVAVTESTPKRVFDVIPAADFRYWSERAAAFDQIVPFRKDMVTITNIPTPDQVWAIRTAGRLFEVIGATAKLGRTLVDSDQNVVVLSHRLWTSCFMRIPRLWGALLLFRMKLTSWPACFPPISSSLPQPSICGFRCASRRRRTSRFRFSRV